MSRPRKWPPTIQLHKPSGQARCRIDGRDVYLGRHGSPEAAAEYARVVAECERTRTPPASRSAAPCRSVADVVAEWWSRESPRLSERGGERARHRDALAPLLRLFGDLDAATLDAERMEEWQLAVAAGSWMNPEERERRRKRRQPIGWCRNVVARHRARVLSVWRWAERRKLLPAGSWGALRAAPALSEADARVRRTPRRKARDFAEVKRVALACRAEVRTILLLCWWSGMRPGEARTMRPCDIDRTRAVWVYRPAAHKSDWRGHDRAVALGPRCQALLRPWLAGSSSPEAYLFRPAAGDAACYSPGSLSCHVRRAAKRVGLPGVFCYCARHSCKKRVTRAAGLDAARSMLGQRSLTTTDRYDAGTDQEQAADAARRLG
jgi:integrase